MLERAETLQGYKLQSLDGELGTIDEFYFDDQHWAVRYLVVATGSWLIGRQVLISPYALLLAVEKKDQHISIDLTKKQIEDSPSLDSDKPVSRQFEEAYYEYFGWPQYWAGPNMWGPFPNIVRDREKWRDSVQGEKAWDPHLRSSHEVTGYDIQATDGEIGHVEDFVIDNETWAIRYLIVDTQNFWPGKKVLISPRWIERVSWEEKKVFINLSRGTIEHSPEYTEQSLITREYETGLHRHYNRQGYWVDDPVPKKSSG
jgi:uncharacterized protein YrrD